MSGESDGRGTGLLAGHEGRMHGNAEAPGGGGGMMKERRAGRAHSRMFFSLYFPLFFFLCFILWETVGRRQGSPAMTGYAGPGQDRDVRKKLYCSHGPSGHM